MNRVLIISDSHGLTKELMDLKKRYATLDIIHCGDSELYLNDPILADMHVVRGNCDFDPKMPDDKIITINDMNFFITHGHRYRVGRDLTTLSYKASETKAEIVCFGHTHMARAEKIGNQIFINPGSIKSPRDRREKTYAILEFEDVTKIRVDFYSLDGKVISELSFETNLD